MSLTKHLELSRTERTGHADLSTPCVLIGQLKARDNLLRHLGLTDDVPTVFRRGVHLCHLCGNGSSTETPCGNPEHLYFGLARENSSDCGKTPAHRLSKPPAYDGSRGHLPTEPLSLKQLVGRYGRGRSTLFHRRDLLTKHLLINPERRWRTVWYSPKDVLEFDRLDYWLTLGFTYEELDYHLTRRSSESPDTVLNSQTATQLLELVKEFSERAHQLLAVPN
jgi:hypothetical protein